MREPESGLQSPPGDPGFEPDGGCRGSGGRGTDGLSAPARPGAVRRDAPPVAILRALLAEYDLLFLDEPFKGLDQETKEIVMADTRRRCAGRTVLFVTHDPAELEALGAVQRLELS